MAPSSSHVHNKNYVYDVFLSFSGEDTRKTFVDHLYDALDRERICTFKDDEKLQKGKEIHDELLQSIQDSRCYIIVFSKRYASSSWCLNELLKIMECHKTNEQTAFPVFYDVDPSDVRKQTGSVGEALAVYKNKSESEVGNWREALKEAANLSGWDVRNTANGHEAQVIKLIVEKVSIELRTTDSYVDDNLVGMEQRMEDLDRSLEIGSSDIRMIGIKGMGGIGKTTLARAIFDKISFNFEGKSFVENVREKTSKFGVEKLQEQVLRNVLKDKSISVQSVHEGKNLMRNKLCGTKVLLVLDDVDREGQLEELAGGPNWFKPGSRIIITTRDEQVLNIYTEKWIHDVNLLSTEEAIRLFSRHAFRKNIPTQEYEDQSREVVNYAAGLPLSIRVLGSFLRGKNKPEWEDSLSRLKTIPLKETLKVLELSYESLEDDYKEIFLDVACFLRHWKKDDAIRMLESCGFHATNGLRVLEQKSLIKIVERFEGGVISVHDRVIEMGENIVRREHPDEPERHSRLWIQEEIEHVLAGNLGSEATRCIDLKITPGINLKGLGNMQKLRCLVVKYEKHTKMHFFGKFRKHDKACQYFPNSLQYLFWDAYHNWCLPKTLQANNLVALEMPGSKIKQLWEGEKVMKKLKFLNLSNSEELRSLDLGLTPSLEGLNLEYCNKLVKLDLHGGCLKSLVYLNLSYCLSLKSISLNLAQLECLEELYLSGTEVKHLPGSICMSKDLKTLDLAFCGLLEKLPEDVGQLESLENLDLKDCCNLKSLPGSICSLQHLTTLNLGNTGIEELPEDLGQLECLEYLYLSRTNVKHLPGSICSLQHLRTLHLQNTDIEELPEDLGQLECLEELKLSITKVKHLPGSICMLKHLKTLFLVYCKLLEKLPEDVGQLESLEILDLTSCCNLKSVPGSICSLQQLRTLNLGNTGIEELPEDLGQLKCLEYLDLSDTKIKHLPGSICKLKHLKTLFLVYCKLLEKLPEDVDQLESLETLYLKDCCNLKSLPGSICSLQHLTKLNLYNSGIEELPEDLGQLECLEALNLSGTKVKHLPGSICMLKHLKTLDLANCELLEKLPEDVGQLESLDELHLTLCHNLREIPNSICKLKCLKDLWLGGCRSLEKLPEEIGNLKCLKILSVLATGITHLPQSISSVKGLEIMR